MSTSQPLPGEKPAAASLPVSTEPGSNPNRGSGPVPIAPETDDEERIVSSPVARLPVGLDVVVPVRAFRVRDLLVLEPGRLIESQWSHGEDVPLAAGDVQLAWTEFEVVDTQLAVRVTRLA